MADLYSTLGTNAKKTFDSTQFGTRDLVFLQIDAQQDIETNYTASNSVFTELIQCLQQRVEIYGVGIPDGQEVTVVVSRQSVPYADGEEADAGGNVSVLQDMINASATFSGVNVFHGKMNGWIIQNDC
jgi:hypothetical protein